MRCWHYECYFFNCEFKFNQDDAHNDLNLTFLKQMVAVKGHFVVYQHKNIYEENERAGGRNDVMPVGPGSEVYASKQTCVALLKL